MEGSMPQVDSLAPAVMNLVMSTSGKGHPATHPCYSDVRFPRRLDLELAHGAGMCSGTSVVDTPHLTAWSSGERDEDTERYSLLARLGSTLGLGAVHEKSRLAWTRLLEYDKLRAVPMRAAIS